SASTGASIPPSFDHQTARLHGLEHPCIVFSRVLRKAAECRDAQEYIRSLARPKKASSRRENKASCSRQIRFLRGRSDGANGWCRGPGLHRPHHGILAPGGSMTHI